MYVYEEKIKSTLYTDQYRSFPFNRPFEVLLEQGNLTQLRDQHRTTASLVWLQIVAFRSKHDGQPVQYFYQMPEQGNHLLKTDDIHFSLEIPVHYPGTPNRDRTKTVHYKRIRFTPEKQGQTPHDLLNLPRRYTYWSNLPTGATSTPSAYTYASCYAPGVIVGT